MRRTTISQCWQHIMPQHLLSRLAGKIANCRQSWFKNCLIKRYIAHYGIDLSCAEYQHAEDYTSFNAFFTRKLQPHARPIATNNKTLISPVDGQLSEWGRLQHGQLLQAKGTDYTVTELIGDNNLPSAYHEGHYMIFYLAPSDYHRVHMPMAGQLTSMTYIPGHLFSVNPRSVAGIPHLFARNERLVCHFTHDEGVFALIWVGACIVGSIHTHWQGTISPLHTKEARSWDYTKNTVTFAKGDELGYFKLGSTIILLDDHPQLRLNDCLQQPTKVNMGQAIANYGASHT